MNQSYSILYIRLEPSPLIDHSLSLLGGIKKTIPNIDLYELDNYSDSLLVNLTQKEILDKERVIIIFQANADAPNNISNIFRLVNALLKNKKEITAYHLGTSAGISVLLKKLKSQQVDTKSTLLVDIKNLIQVTD